MHRTHRTLPLLLAVAVSFSLPAFAADTAPKDAKTGAQAAQDTKADANADAKAQTKVSEADARKTALASVANGTVQSSKLVTDKGRQVWAFELKGASSPNFIVVHVDANSGRIVAKSIKTAAPAPAAKPKKS
jgi:uncharacterized membrane protein YkoI